MAMPVVLVVGEPTGRERAAALRTEGFHVVKAADGHLRPSADASCEPDIVILVLDGERSVDRLAWIGQLRRADARLPIVVVAESSTEALAIAALKAGANDYLRAPFTAPDLLAAVRHGLARRPPRGDDRADGSAASTTPCMVGLSDSMRRLRENIETIAVNGSDVLITGETGTGKELAAQLIHLHSRRHRKPLVSINCAAIPDSLLESELFGYERGAFTGAQTAKDGHLGAARGGTVFLDEIGDMSPFAQAKILRALDTRVIHRLGSTRAVPLDIRVLAATNQNLEQSATDGRFRRDLYYRLDVARVRVPPLRERKEDIPLLVDHYVGEFNRRFNRVIEGFPQALLEQLLHYHWPGNVRELRNLVEGLYAQLPDREVTRLELPAHFFERLCLAPPSLSERDRLLSTLLATNWNKSRAAARLNWSRMTLYRKLAKYRLVPAARQSKRAAS